MVSEGNMLRSVVLKELRAERSDGNLLRLELQKLTSHGRVLSSFSALHFIQLSCHIPQLLLQVL